MAKKISIILLSVFILFVIVILSIGSGSVSIGIKNVIEAFYKGTDDIERAIIVDIRMPRIVLAILIGANLALSGVLLQVVMQNPLADPGLTGVSSGASLAAIIVMLLMPQYMHAMPIIAFLGGIVACTMVYALAWKNGIKPLRIILAGVAVNAILGGITSLISILNSEKIQSVLYWLNGSLAAKGWKDVGLILPYSIIGYVLSFLCIRSANLMQLGDEKAHNLGVNVNRSRVLLSLLAVFLAAISTSVVGIIGFVGLIVPHICRLIIGSDYKYLIPLSIIGGSITLLMADTIARTVARPIELPVGTIMAVIGGPFFLGLMRKGDS